MRGALLLAVGCLGQLHGCSLLRFGRASDYTASPHFAEVGQMWTEGRELRVVTFNIHDLYWLSEHRAARVLAIGKLLAELVPDIVCLQEGFVAGDVAVIAAALASSSTSTTRT